MSEPRKHACDNCRYFVPNSADAEIGECRVNPPVIVDALIDPSTRQANQSNYDLVERATFFPVTCYYLFCGKWEPKE